MSHQLYRVNISRLMAMANLLDLVPKDRFDIGAWVSRYEVPAKKFLWLFTIEPACQFAGCAIGWAAYLDLFPGLSIEGRKWDSLMEGRTPVYTDENGVRFFGITAVQKVFGLNMSMANYLFMPCSYTRDDETTAQMVADRIRRLIKKIEGRKSRANRFFADCSNVIEISA